jgi:hypothetical protein
MRRYGGKPLRPCFCSAQSGAGSVLPAHQGAQAWSSGRWASTIGRMPVRAGKAMVAACGLRARAGIAHRDLAAAQRARIGAEVNCGSALPRSTKLARFLNMPFSQVQDQPRVAPKTSVPPVASSIVTIRSSWGCPSGVPRPILVQHHARHRPRRTRRPFLDGGAPDRPHAAPASSRCNPNSRSPQRAASETGRPTQLSVPGRHRLAVLVYDGRL